MFGGRCRPGGPQTPDCRPGWTSVPGQYRPGTVPSGGMFPFSNASGNQPTPQPAPAPSPAPPVNVACHDILTDVPFSVPALTDFTVSGGGAALSAAIIVAADGDRLVITDSLNYDPIAIQGKNNLTIKADAGQTPTITALPGPGNHCVDLQDGNSGIALLGLTLIGSGNSTGSASPLVDGLIALPSGVGGGIDRVIIEDCIFMEPVLTATEGVPGILLKGTNGLIHHDVWVHRCSFRNVCGSTLVVGSIYGAITIGGFSNVYIQNCEIIRDNAVLPRGSSKMKGIVSKNINMVVEDVLANDIGTADQNQAFIHATNGDLGSAVGASSWRNCVAYNCRIGFEMDLAGATMTVNQCVANVDVLGRAGGVQVRRLAGSLVVQNCQIVGAGDAIAFSAAGITEDHNNVFNWGATGKVLDPTDITVNPVFEDVANGDWLSTAPACQAAASDGGLIGMRYSDGEKIIWCNH